LIAERAGRAAQALPAVLAVPTATGHYTTWSGRLAYCDTGPRSKRRVSRGQARIATWIRSGFIPNYHPRGAICGRAARRRGYRRDCAAHRRELDAPGGQVSRVSAQHANPGFAWFSSWFIRTCLTT